MVITIDGPAGAGKSTAARLIAKKLKFLYVDTGAMYRAVTLKAVWEKVDLDRPQAVIELASRSRVELKEDKNGQLMVFLDGKDVSEEIRSPELTNAVFKVARIPQLRSIMVGWQREYGKNNNIVMEGRDIGTVVFPNAEKKFYLDAEVEERARRRFKELSEKGMKVDLEDITRQIKERDEKDRTRSCAPLKQADDAIYINNTKMTAEEVARKMLAEIKILR